jgi:hypothetical protein
MQNLRVRIQQQAAAQQAGKMSGLQGRDDSPSCVHAHARRVNESLRLRFLELSFLATKPLYIEATDTKKTLNLVFSARGGFFCLF